MPRTERHTVIQSCPPSDKTNGLRLSGSTVGYRIWQSDMNRMTERARLFAFEISRGGVVFKPKHRKHKRTRISWRQFGMAMELAQNLSERRMAKVLEAELGH